MRAGSSSKKPMIVERHHEPDETSCAHALNLLLTLQKAAGVDGGEDAERRSNEIRAGTIMPE